uniref:Aspartyl proteinase n=1 Tax=Ganoderma boninense TaxID=34458 RepID=A0A5K1K6B0_9APHY|nr:Aspartyl proteinase [Ganoderma boninense]
MIYHYNQTCGLGIADSGLPPPADPNSLLARHEASLLQNLRGVLKNISHHRSTEVNRLILPHCQPVMEAIRRQMSYEAAVAQGVRQCLVYLYVAKITKLDSASYWEHVGLGQRVRREMAALSSCHSTGNDVIFAIDGTMDNFLRCRIAYRLLYQFN